MNAYENSGIAPSSRVGLSAQSSRLAPIDRVDFRFSIVFPYYRLRLLDRSSRFESILNLGNGPQTAVQSSNHAHARYPVKRHSHLYYIQNPQSIALFGELVILSAPESDFPGIPVLDGLMQ
jgi:hypothetical protein